MLPQLDWTGERAVPQLQGNITYEHLHRYALAMEMARDKVVLDIACGEGYGSNLLSQVAREVIGVDVEPDVVAHAHRAYSKNNLTFRLGSCWAIPVRSQSIDVVVSFETLEHHDRHQEMMVECKRVLRPDGLLIISTPDKRNYTDVPGESNAFHVRELYLRDFERLLKNHFKHSVILGQRMHLGSMIGPIWGGSCSFVSFEGQFSSVQRESGLRQPMYLIGICSDYEDLPPVPIGSFESKELKTDWHMLVNEKDRSLDDLRLQVAQRDQTMQALQIQLLAEQQRSAQAIAAKDGSLEDLRRQAAQRDQTMQALQVQLQAEHLGQKDQEICRLTEQQGRMPNVTFGDPRGNGSSASKNGVIESCHQDAKYDGISSSTTPVADRKTANVTETSVSTPLLLRLADHLSMLQTQMEAISHRDAQLQPLLLRVQDHLWYHDLIRRIREVIRTATPEDATVVVISKGDEELLNLRDRKAWHFPQDASGAYAGHYPGESAAAIAQLEELRQKGAQFLLLPTSSLWWLDDYPEFGRYVKNNYRLVHDQRDTCLVFALK